LKIVANSTPIYPPPIMTISDGIFLVLNASSLVMILSPSGEIPGRPFDFEPGARIIASPSIISFSSPPYKRTT
jgi:hypothetical protein